MIMQLNKMCFGLLILMSMLSMQSATAAPDEAMARAQFMLRQISAERDQLQTDKAALQQQLDALQKKYDSLENKSTTSSGMMKQQSSQLRADLEDERKAHDATRVLLAATTAEKNNLAETATSQQQSLALCITNNHKLYDINLTLMDHYENKGVWDSLVQAGSVTGLSQVKIENLIDDLQYKQDDLRIKQDSAADEKQD